MTKIDNRYSRQTVLAEIGEAGQQKLANASVLCVGAGGLGSPALLYLGASGIGHIGIIDGDTIDESNLQRQVLFKTASVGDNKAISAKQRLTALNPHINITAYPHMLDNTNISDLFSVYDIILDGTDNFATKFVINDGAVKYAKPLVYGAIQGFDGQASVFNADTHSPCYRCVYPEPPSGRVLNCAEAGVIGAVAGLVGVTQALQVIQLIVDDDSFSPLVGRLWVLDTKTMHTRTLSIHKNPDCTVCGIPPQDIVLQYTAPMCTASLTVSATDARALTDTVFIDVREQCEWDAGHIVNAHHHPLSALNKGVYPDMPTDTPIVIYCQKDPRSHMAGEILHHQGFTQIRILSGGIEAWLQQGYSVV